MSEIEPDDRPRGFAIFVAVAWLLGATVMSYSMPRLADFFASLLGSTDKLPALVRIVVRTPAWIYLAEAILIPAVIIGKEWLVGKDEASFFDRVALVLCVVYVLGSYILSFLVIQGLQRSLMGP